MLTPRQHDLLKYIKAYIAEHDGVSPSIEEMQAALGLKSKSGIVRFLGRLEERGAIRRRRYMARSIDVLRKPGSGDVLEEVAAAVKRLQGEAGPIFAAQVLVDLARDMLANPDQWVIGPWDAAMAGNA